MSDAFAERPGGRRLLRYGMLAAAGAAFGAAGCASDGPASIGAPPAPGIALVAPAAGDTVRGVVGLEARVLRSGAKRVLFVADGVVIDSALAPPWRGRWRATPPVGARPVSLSARLLDLRGEAAVSPPVSVWVIDDQPPSVLVRAPVRSVWIEQRDGLALTATAWDPESGGLPADRIRWSGSGLARPLQGGELPLVLLPPFDQTVRAEATDEAGLTGSRAIRVRPFSYVADDTPEACIQNLWAALRAGDAESFLVRCHDQFDFVPCAGEAVPAGWPQAWDRTLFAAAVHAWMNDPAVGWIEWEARADRVERWSSGSEIRAWAECGSIRLGWSDAPIDPDGATGEDELPRAAGAAGLLLARNAEGRWSLLGWRDRPGSGQPSLAALLAKYAGLGPAGAGPAECLRSALNPLPVARDPSLRRRGHSRGGRRQTDRDG